MPSVLAVGPDMVLMLAPGDAGSLYLNWYTVLNTFTLSKVLEHMKDAKYQTPTMHASIRSLGGRIGFLYLLYTFFTRHAFINWNILVNVKSELYTLLKAKESPATLLHNSKYLLKKNVMRIAKHRSFVTVLLPIKQHTGYFAINMPITITSTLRSFDILYVNAKDCLGWIDAP